VHDGVLQVLGFVRRRGAELGGDAGELGTLAGEQEYALRTLLTTGPAPVDVHGRRDLAAALRMLASARISVSTPAHPVELSAHAVDELAAVVAAALGNVAVHVGSDARAWVLLEDTGDGVEISVRDEGPGIPAGRLAAAEAEGRLGVARSMRGRMRDLGGEIRCDTGPGRGTEWIIQLSRRERA
jgi:signal transduction histidine kinase